MRFAIADPPYLGRAERWYGDGRGHGAGRGRADFHPEASKWDNAAAHIALLDDVVARFDGWAIAMHESSLPLYLAHAPSDAHVAVWVRGNAIPTGSRVRALWEPVLYRIPPSRRGRGEVAGEDDVLNAGISGGFPGRKPEAWTHWVLRLLGVRPDVGDEVVDMFPGTDAVARAIDTFTVQPPTRSRQRRAPEAKMQQLRRVARAGRGKRAPVLAALRAGASVRAVAAEAGVSTSTVQRWKREAEEQSTFVAQIDT